MFAKFKYQFKFTISINVRMCLRYKSHKRRFYLSVKCEDNQMGFDLLSKKDIVGGVREAVNFAAMKKKCNEIIH